MNSSMLALARNIIRSNYAELRVPYRLTYILTYRCQFRCIMCNIWKKSGNNELSLEQIKNFFSRSDKFFWINLSGGEIFLRKDLLAIVDIIIKTCKQLYLLDFPTNGYAPDLIEDAVSHILNRYNLPKLLITVSLDGPRELHDKIRNMPGAWLKAVETFRRLRTYRSRNFNVFLGMTLQPANLNSVAETIRTVDKQIGNVGYGDFHVNILQHSSHYYDNAETARFGDGRAAWASLRKIHGLRRSSPVDVIGHLERRYQRLARKYLESGRTPVPCQALSSSFFMDPGGNVYPCSIYDKKIGNIMDFDFEIGKLWSSALRSRVREEIRKELCPHCWTPCEAYQSILANLFSVRHWFKHD